MIDPSAWRPRVVALFTGAALVWAVSLYGLLVDEDLIYALAVVPRRLDGLSGILGAPLVHGSFAHLAANTFPLLMLGGMVAMRGVAYYVTATLAIAVLGGLGLWVFGRSAAHIGASGLIFGYFGLLVGRGYYERSLRSVAVAILTAVVYGGLLAGVLPRESGGVLGGPPVRPARRRTVCPRRARPAGVMPRCRVDRRRHGEGNARERLSPLRRGTPSGRPRNPRVFASPRGPSATRGGERPRTPVAASARHAIQSARIPGGLRLDRTRG